MSAPTNERYTLPRGMLAFLSSLPDDVLPRFIADLPMMIGVVRQQQATLRAIHDKTGVELDNRVDVWIDDGLHIGRTVVTFDGEVVADVLSPAPAPAPATL